MIDIITSVVLLLHRLHRALALESVSSIGCDRLMWIQYRVNSVKLAMLNFGLVVHDDVTILCPNECFGWLRRTELQLLTTYVRRVWAIA